MGWIVFREDITMGLTLALLAYKEAENLKVLFPKIIDKLNTIGEDYEILVVDTAEPLDNTKEVCEEYGARYINQELPKFGGAMKTAIKYASKDKFMIMDSDGSHDPEYIIPMHKLFTEKDMDVVIGSRYTKGGVTDDNWSSRVMSKCLNFAYRICTGVKAKDLSTNFRIYRTDLIKDLDLKCEVYDILEETLLKIKLKKKDMKIGETPITFHKRMYGQSKRNLIPFIISYMKTFFYLLKLRIFRK